VPPRSLAFHVLTPRAGCSLALRTILRVVGFNPYRKFRARPTDYVLVAAAVVVVLALVVWAFAG
jgi:hypothetical protein